MGKVVIKILQCSVFRPTQTELGGLTSC